jgi:cell division protein FtsN
MVDRRRGGGPEDWSEEEWPGEDWERAEQRPRPPAPPPIDRARVRVTPPVEEDIDSDLSRVMDDPMFNALPGGVPLPSRGRAAMRGPDRFSARHPRTGLSAGQKILLWLGFAFVAGVSFAAGLLVGASGDRDLFPWLPVGIAHKMQGIVEKPVDAGAAPDASGEGVISFSDHGHVPSKPEEGEEPLRTEKAAPKAEARPEAASSAAKKGVPAAEDAQATREAASAEAPATQKKVAAPAPEKKAPEAARAPSDEMTFYDTATGKREAPGLAAEGSGGGDSEAVPEVPSGARAGANNEVPREARADANNEVPSGARADAPLGADVLAQRRAEQAAPPPQVPREARADDQNAAPAESPQGLPSGAEILARRRAEAAAQGGPAAGGEAPVGAAPSGYYTVQVATLTSSEEARAIEERLASKGFKVRVERLSGPSGTTLYRVRVGRYSDERSAQRALDQLKREPGTSPFIKLE